MRRSMSTVIVAAAGYVAAAAQAGPLQPQFMKLGGPAPAPPGFLAFCVRLPDQCGLEADSRQLGSNRLERALYSKFYWPALFGGAAIAAEPPQAGASPSRSGPILNPVGSAPPDIQPLPDDSRLMAEVTRVNVKINHAIRYVSDKALYGDENYWHFALGPGGPVAGDCKDYVLEKRRVLIADGISPSDLSIAIVETPWRQSHAVLLVSTQNGELAMDTLSDQVKPWWEVRYRWVERQAPGRQLDWVAIG